MINANIFFLVQIDEMELHYHSPTTHIIQQQNHKTFYNKYWKHQAFKHQPICMTPSASQVVAWHLQFVYKVADFKLMSSWPDDFNEFKKIKELIEMTP
jgi:hypothetical protein